MNNNQNKSGNLLADFFTFKFMILEVLAPIIFALALLGLIGFSFNLMRASFGMGMFCLVGGFLALRIVFELIMVMFSILGTLRQIRDKIPERSTEQISPSQENQ